MYKLAVDMVSLGMGQVSSQREGMEQDGVQPCVPGAANTGDPGQLGWERGDALGGERGAKPPPHRGRAGANPRHRHPLLLLLFALLWAHYPGSGCISSCLRINWQLSVLFLLALRREMKLFVVLHVGEFVRKGDMLEIIAANSNFLCHLSM